MKFGRGFAEVGRQSPGAGLGMGRALIFAFASFHGVNAPTVTDFRLPRLLPRDLARGLWAALGPTVACVLSRPPLPGAPVAQVLG